RHHEQRNGGKSSRGPAVAGGEPPAGTLHLIPGPRRPPRKENGVAQHEDHKDCVHDFGDHGTRLYPTERDGESGQRDEIWRKPQHEPAELSDSPLAHKRLPLRVACNACFPKSTVNLSYLDRIDKYSFH